MPAGRIRLALRAERVDEHVEQRIRLRALVTVTSHSDGIRQHCLGANALASDALTRTRICDVVLLRHSTGESSAGLTDLVGHVNGLVAVVVVAVGLAFLAGL